MGRAPCCEKVGLKKGRWTAEEDDLLVKYIKTNGEGSWRSLPKKAGLLRCGKSCRLRWINYLREDLKRGNISKEEEDTIIQLRANLGNRWSVIAGHLPGRTDNEIKNYWNSHLSKKIDGSNNKDEEEKEDTAGATKVRKRRGGRPSKKKKAAEQGESTPCKERASEKQKKGVEELNDDGAADGGELMVTDREHEQSALKDSPSLSVVDPERNQCGGALSTSVSSSNLVEKERGKEGNGGEVDQVVVSNEGGWLSLDEIEKLVNWEWEDIALSLWEGEGEGVGEPLVWDDGYDHEDSGKSGGFFGNSNEEFDAFRDVDYFDNWLLSDVLI